MALFRRINGKDEPFPEKGEVIRQAVLMGEEVVYKADGFEAVFVRSGDTVTLVERQPLPRGASLVRGD